MTYTTPDYDALMRNVDRMKRVQVWVDMARKIKAMQYSGAMSISTERVTGAYACPNEPIHLSVNDRLKGEVIKFLSARCEEIAQNILADPPEEFDVKKACGV